MLSISIPPITKSKMNLKFVSDVARGYLADTPRYMRTLSTCWTPRA